MVDLSGYVTHASHFLNDTTLANPIVVGYYNDDLHLPYLMLSVTDSVGTTSLDSIKITFSTFTMTLGGTILFYMEQGDSVLCSGGDVFGGIGTPSLLWTPNYGLIDSTTRYFWANPDTTTPYTLTITDSMGCSQSGVEGIVVVIVWPVGIEDGRPNTNIKIYPNPASDFVTIERTENPKNERFTLYDMLGNEVLNTNLNSNNQTIDVSQLARGAYSFIVGETSGKLILK